MQAIILAGGQGTRLRPLTDERPKGMVLLSGRPLIEHVMEELPDAVADIVIVVGYRGTMIREHFGDSWKGRRIRYVEQAEQLGTWHAVSLAKDFITEKFIMLQCDDIGDKAAFTEASRYDYCILAAESEHPERFGVVTLQSDGTLAGIAEKPEHPQSNLVYTGTLVLSPDVFSVPLIKNERLGEFFLTDLVDLLAKTRPIHVVRQGRWITVTYPEDVLKAEALLKKP
jgi:glucose-1-phosphate thymidylyltransferase